jgi:hypothetical protein
VDAREPALTTPSWTAQPRAALSALAIVGGLVCGAGAVALVLANDHYEDRIPWAVLLPVLGWSFIDTGLYAWLRGPDSRVGC